MQLYQLQNFGLDGLNETECPPPEIAPDEVLVEMRAWSLNYRDLMLVKGIYNPRLKLPCVPLSDGAGKVTAVGALVKDFKPGDRVASNFFENWTAGELDDAGAASALGGGGKGILAEYVALKETGVICVPDHLSDEESAMLPCAALTAWSALITHAQIKAGDTVLLLGTGGVSLFALQFALLHGARVIITSSSDEKLERARALGAHEMLNYHVQPEWGKEVRRLTGGRGVDVVVEVGGAGTFPQSLRAVRRGGTIALIGVLAQGNDVNLVPVLMNGVRVQGIYVGSRAEFAAMNAAIDFHKLKPVVDKSFDFGEARAAYQMMADATHFGKICIRRA